MLCVSYVAIIVQSRVKELNKSLEEAALDLGATPFKVFFLITLPLISQALMSGWLLSFTLSFDDLVLSAFLSGPGSTTLPLVVFSRVRLGLNPEMNALATIFISVVTIGVIAVNRWMQIRERKRTRDMQMAFAVAEAADAATVPPQPATARKSLGAVQI
jgi:putrescine transport system permease protein